MNINKIVASDGMILTNGMAYGHTIYIGTNDRISNWYEITTEEYEKIQLDGMRNE